MMDETQIRNYARKIGRSRMRLLNKYPFYGLLLMYLKFTIDRDLPTESTDGEKIYFGADFLDNLTDEELDFVLMHEIMHIALQHIFRGKDKVHDLFDIACDIVANSNIMLEQGRKTHFVLSAYGEAVHLAHGAYRALGEHLARQAVGEQIRQE
jgi:predicted metal-dependent peptidase